MGTLNKSYLIAKESVNSSQETCLMENRQFFFPCQTKIRFTLSDKNQETTHCQSTSKQYPLLESATIVTCMPGAVDHLPDIRCA